MPARTAHFKEMVPLRSSDQSLQCNPGVYPGGFPVYDSLEIAERKTGNDSSIGQDIGNESAVRDKLCGMLVQESPLFFREETVRESAIEFGFDPLRDAFDQKGKNLVGDFGIGFRIRVHVFEGRVRRQRYSDPDGLPQSEFFDFPDKVLDTLVCSENGYADFGPVSERPVELDRVCTKDFQAPINNELESRCRQSHQPGEDGRSDVAIREYEKFILPFQKVLQDPDELRIQRRFASQNIQFSAAKRGHERHDLGKSFERKIPEKSSVGETVFACRAAATCQNEIRHAEIISAEPPFGFL